MVRSKSRTHSSRSRSRSLSRSRSRTRSSSRTRSRKKRYSSRSRSRSYSRSRSRDRNYPREYRRDYRGNRGMRRPYGFRGRGRGMYPGGGRFHHRGGFRPNWHNRRYSRSPRRGRSRSRSPKRRSTSRRSRSDSRQSRRSSGSSGSSSSSRSSPSPRRRALQEKVGKKGEEGREGAGRGEGVSDRPEGAAGGVVLAKSEPKRPVLISDSWLSISAYDDGSPSPSPAPPGQSSSQSDAPPASSVHPHSEEHSPDSALGRYSPAHSPRGRSPREVFSSSTGSRGLFMKSDRQDIQKAGKFFKRYTAEEEEDEEGDSRPSLRERGAGSWGSEPRTDSMQVKGGWGTAELEQGSKKTETVPFLGDSPEAAEQEDEEEEDELQAYRQPYKFRLSNQSEPMKAYLGGSPWMLDDAEDAGKYKSKVSRAGREGGGACQFKDPGFVLKRTGKTGHAEEGKGTERRQDRLPGKRDVPSSWHVKAVGLTELVTHGPLLQKIVDVRDKPAQQNESPSGERAGPGEAPCPEVKIKMAAMTFESMSSVAGDRSLASALAQSSRKEHGFRSVFEHIKRPQALKSSSDSYILHIVSLVHHVQEHYFKSTGVTLHERFTVYQKAAVEQEARHKSPEIHRRIDISPSAFKKVRLFKEDFKVTHRKGENKTRSEPVDLRHSIDRKQKDRGREGDDRRESRETSPSGKPEKLGKEFKDYKDYKSVKEESKCKSKEKERSRSSSGSSLSQDGKDRRRAKEEEEGKPHPEQKDYPGFQSGGPRARGTFQFRIRGGRGWGRGVFGGPAPGPSAPNIPFQQRPKEEEWDPEYTPRSRKYFLHDDRDDGMDYWAKRGRGRGLFQRGRGRFPFKKSNSSPKWTHDKYQGEGNAEEEEEDNNEEGEARDEKHKEEKAE